MALHQRRETSGRTRFLLALTLSTLTALAVAAPLAIQAVNAPEVNLASDTPRTTDDADPVDDLLSGERADRRLSEYDIETQGGIGSRIPAKAQSQTSKSETDTSAPRTTESVLTNPTTTTTAAPTTTTPPSTETTTTTQPTSTTSTTVDSSSSSTTSSTTSTTQPTTTTTAPDPTSTSTSSTTSTSIGGPTSSGTGRP